MLEDRYLTRNIISITIINHSVRAKMTDLLLQTTMNAFMLAGLYILVALGLSLVYGVMHIVNFAHGAFFMLGAYFLYFLFARWDINFLLSFVMVVTIVGTLGALVEKYLYHRYWGQTLPILIIAVGLTQIMQQVAFIAFGITEKNVPSIFQGAITFLGTRLSLERLMVIVIALVIIVGLIFFMSKTKAGQAMRAAAQDTDAAALQGVNIARTAMLAMFLGCALAAAGGIVAAPVFAVHAFMGEMLLMKAFMVVIIGGLGSLPGAIIGGLIVGVIDSFGQTFIGYEAQILAFILVIIVLLTRPTGLFGGITFRIT